MPLILSLKKAAAAGISLRFIQVPLGEGLPLATALLDAHRGR